MKKITFLKAALLAVVMMVGNVGLFAQGTETFDHSATGNKYTTISWEGTNGLTWQATDARGDQVITTGDKAILVRTGSITGALTVAQQSAGIGTLKFDYMIPFSDASKNITVTITAGSKTIVHNLGNLTVKEVYNSGNIVVESSDATNLILEVSSVASGARLVIDNLSWTAYDSSSPTISVSPSSLNFGNVVIGSTSASQIVNVTGANLTAGINVAVSGTDASQFSVSTNSIPKEGGDLTVTYTPSSVAETHTAAITLSSTGAADVIINLTGKTVNPLNGNGSEETPYTIADVFALNNSLSGTQWVEGYIVGVPTGGGGGVLTTVEFENFSSTSAIVLADSQGETDLTKMTPVQLLSGTIRDALNLKDNPTLMGRKVKVLGTLEAYFTVPGVKNTENYYLSPPTSLRTTKSDANAWTSNGQIHLQAASGEMIEIFNTAGQKIVNRMATDGLNSIDVQAKGVVVVKVGNRVSKVIL